MLFVEEGFTKPHQEAKPSFWENFVLLSFFPLFPSTFFPSLSLSPLSSLLSVPQERILQANYQ